MSSAAKYEECEALVVGAGPTGMTMAVDLARRGIDVRVVERATAFHQGTRARGLNPRSQEAFDDLGVVERVTALGSTTMKIRMHNGSQSSIDVDFASRFPPSTPGFPYGRGLVVSTSRIEAALRERLAELGRSVELDRKLISLSQDDDGVSATLLDSAGQEHRIRAAYVVGADGGRSTTRKLGGFTFAGATRNEQHLYVGDVIVQGFPHDEIVHMWSTGVVLAANPHADTWWMTAGVQPDANGNSPEPSLELFQELFHARTGLTGVRFLAAPWMSKYRFNVRMVDRYRAGRILLAGDAAHVHLPAGGQGMNTGIQDAYNLGWKLAAVLRGAEPSLLDSYERERLPLARKVLEESTKRGNTIAGSSLFAKVLMTGVTRVPPLADAFWRWWAMRSSHLDLHYRGSSLSESLGRPRIKLRSGDRVPDARLWSVSENRELRLFDVLRGPHWTVLGLSGAVRGSFGQGVRLEALGDTLLDHWGEARSLLGNGKDSVLVIRPDGYLGLACGNDPRAIAGYLARFSATMNAA